MDSAERAVAIVGVGAILPDAPNAPAFWQNIVNKRYSITDVPPERWNPEFYYDPDPYAPDKTYSKIGGWVRGFEFDWKQFRMPPKVAAAMDEGQQWAVTIAAEALADYGYPARPLPTERTAVILGTAMGGELHYITQNRIVFPEYADALASSAAFNQLPPDLRRQIIAEWHSVIDQRIPAITEDTMPGELPNIVSGRVANLLNLRGPNFITDAACASSFAALNAAIEMLTQHQVDAVIAGGVDRNMGAPIFVKFCKIGALSATGSRPFGDGADGFVMGEGSGAFLLKRLADAERNGDKIYAVIRGVGGSSDGKGKGITAPNPVGQQLAIERAWEIAGLDPATATLVEAHGTSTRVGDVVEVESLAKVFGGAARQSIAIGSAKSNIGHLKAGAGAAGLLKATLALYHKILPPTLNAERPNPNIDFSRTPFYPNHNTREWSQQNGAPRRCGVSAYGFGGTNFHVVLEEHIPGALTQKNKSFAGVSVPQPTSGSESNGATLMAARPAPVRGIFALGAGSPLTLQEKLDEVLVRVRNGWMPPMAALPDTAVIHSPERLIIDYGDHDELLDRLQKARKVMSFDNPQAWKAVQAQGIFRGSGRTEGKIAFLFPGQGSQYANMGRELAELSPTVAKIFAEADAVMTPILGKPLTDYIFVNADDSAAMMQANFDLMQTEICQPAMLTLDMAMMALLADYGFKPDVVMGHSLGEYAALIAAGIMPFADALEAAAARGSEMANLDVPDNGKMAAVLAPYNKVEEILGQIDGYVVPANINSSSQCVIGGASTAVEQAVAQFEAQGYRAMTIPVSHAFHTSIVAPASAPLRQVLDRLRISEPTLPLVANVTGAVYPTAVNAIKDILQKQIASPVQWVKGLETLYDMGVRLFLEVGPKRALRGFVNDVFGDKEDVTALLTNHPKQGTLPTFNQALCGLYAAGYNGQQSTSNNQQVTNNSRDEMMESNGSTPVQLEALGKLLTQALQQTNQPTNQPTNQVYDRNAVPLGSVVISGTGLGLPGAEKPVMDPDNALRILRGEQFIDLIPERFRNKIVAKRITRLVKAADGSGSFVTIDDPSEVIKLAGRPGSFDLEAEYGVDGKLVEALDITTQLAMAAGLDALREAGIPLTQTYKKTTTGKYLPQDWKLPPSLQDETGVIFASAFPGGDRFAEEFSRYYTYVNRRSQLEALEDVRRYASDGAALNELNRRIGELRGELEREPYTFDRRFLFRILAMGHSQFAQYIGARGPNTHVNAACASTAQGVAIAEDWIRNGRCRRVIVLGADNVTGDNLMEWVGAGFLAVGAATTNDRVAEAALPFDLRRHGTIMGMGACALVVESEDAVRERGMRGIVELLSSETSNSAFHGTRLDVNHIALVMNNLVTAAERRFGLNRFAMAAQTVFMSHETYTPARGGSAAAEVTALRETFGEAANEIIMANTKGFTGHPMGVGVEDVIAVKILEYGIVPPVPNFKVVDPDLGPLNLSRGGRYPVQYALHLAAGFGSQIAMTLTRRIPGGLNRSENPLLYQRWLADISGYDVAETEVEKRVLRIKADGAPPRVPAPNRWQVGTGPVQRTLAGDGAMATAVAPARMVMEKTAVPAPMPPAMTPPPAPKLEPAPAPVQVEKIVEPVTETAVPQPQSPVSNRQSPAADTIAAQIIALVAEQTGYPEDMLDLDLDMEADLGIDTVKQAETFAAIREEFAIPARSDLNLRAYNTLEKVVGFVKEMRPDLAESSKPEAVRSEPEVVSDLQVSNRQSPAADTIAAQIIALVAEQTGYPEDMLDLDLDMEADLGIDTVKQAETFAAIREEFAIPARSDLNLRAYNTLEKVVGFVKEMRPDLAAISEPEAVSAKPEVAQSTPSAAAAQSPISNLQSPPADSIVAQVLALVAEQTGYPEDMLELDLDMEADLGIDTVKQAETFAAIRQTFDIPRRDDLNLRTYNTLERVIEFVREMRPDLAESSKPEDVSSEPEEAAPQSPIANRQSLTYRLEDADQMPRRVAVAALRPSLSLCKPTGVTLDENSRVIVAMDEGGIGKALTGRLRKLGVNVLSLETSKAGELIEKQLAAWLAEGPVQGVYWLPALDVEPAIDEMDLAMWRELNRVRVKNLYTTMRSLYESVSEPGSFLVAATRMGGLHGYGPEGAAAPLGGGVTGFTKAYKRERPDVLVKAVDFEVSRKTAQPADLLIAETLSDPGVVEVGYVEEQRFTVTVVEQPATYGMNGLTLNRDSVFVVTGAAGGITSEIIGDLAAHSGGTFYLLDLVGEPDRASEKIALFRSDKEALKQQLIAEAKTAGERPTPAFIEKQLATIERDEAALRAIEAVEAAGGVAYYHSVNLLDGSAVAAVVADVRRRYGRIDVLIHAGGIEISKILPDKPAEQFNLVFDIKADGFFSLLNAAKGMDIGATVVFSSVAGRFGNNGQTDYSAANDLLCKMTSSLRTTRPKTKGIAIDWTAWGGIGMASRGSLPKIMAMAGIDMLPPEAGVPTVRRELVANAFKGEIVVGGALGVMAEEFDATGGLDLGKAEEFLTQRREGAKFLMVGNLTGAKLYGGWQATTTLDPKAQPFLYDHAMEGTPLLPGVMGTETFAQLAALLAPGYHVAAVEQEEFSSPFKFYRLEAQTLWLTAVLTPVRGGSLIAHTELWSRRDLGKAGQQEKRHFTANVRLTPTPLGKPDLTLTPPPAKEMDITAEAIYNIYFHGPAYQVLERAKVEGSQAIGLLADNLPPNTQPAEAAALMAPRLIELVFQTAGVWQIRTHGEMALPAAIHSVTTFRQPEAANGRRLYAIVKALDNGAAYDAQVVDEKGNLYVIVSAYQTVALPGKVTL
ncbi:MAG: SDR family NAD(P)-dependent oxidoreductase [Chloroflexi bacterium]|nr:SDR family NAD(P)-dependent oxidoreductase [Chloroflexota bacterium]MBP7044800.1 SDR family NAD(P)-dependent oxidoreductase [Chloroflexota bacterium]